MMIEPACRGELQTTDPQETIVNMRFFWRGIAARPTKDLKIRSSLVRRLVQAQDDSAKHRIRAWLCDLDDEQLSSLGCTSDDIAVLRDTQSPNSRRRERA
jgi:hypothetical protein